MNPSYNNGVGAQVPQGTPQMPITSGVGGVSGVSGVSGGNIVVGGMPEKKSRKGVVILIILVVLLVLVGGGYLLWQNGVFGSNNTSRQATTGLQEKYNSYVNYVLWGVESNEALDATAIDAATAYFEGLEDNALVEYEAMANAKYEEFRQGYEAEVDENRIDFAILRSYFQDYPGVKEVGLDEMISLYNTSGENAVRSEIVQNYSKTIGEASFDAFLEAEKDLATYNLSLIVKANAGGCAQNGKMVLSCENLTSEDRIALNDRIVAVADAISAMNVKAHDTLVDLYNSLYGVEQESTSDEESEDE